MSVLFTPRPLGTAAQPVCGGLKIRLSSFYRENAHARTSIAGEQLASGMRRVTACFLGEDYQGLSIGLLAGSIAFYTLFSHDRKSHSQSGPM
ncbi:uncharacterized protein LOC119173760 isoform X2 [Rhipicephalus microplus]|uniref:uncharacterized protein LOC119173760 isoform X2 n=1 Tax=Rhipicephalus microplus TaxID=6941 RepID=UPI003F6D339F